MALLRRPAHRRYRTDPARVRELLPEPLELADEDLGAVALIWADWQSCPASGEELLDPVRAQYKEAFAVVRRTYEGQTYTRCVHIRVDQDFAIARGPHQGYPKKLGSIHQTRPHPYGPAPRIEAGARSGATLAAADRRLARAVATLREPSETNGFVNGHPMAHHRWLPSVEKGKGLAPDELIESGAASFEGGQPWVGDAELAHNIASFAGKHGTWITAIDDEYLPSTTPPSTCGSSSARDCPTSGG